MSWRIEHDVLIVDALRVAVQRMGLAHWQPAARLRSWGIAPMHGANEGVLVPCGAGEALWLGAWLEGSAGPARVALRDEASGRSATLTLPPGCQLTSLGDASQGEHAITLDPPDQPASPPRRVLRLSLATGSRSEDLALVLLTPGEWAARSGREPPAARSAPPPLPPRLG